MFGAAGDLLDSGTTSFHRVVRIWLLRLRLLPRPAFCLPSRLRRCHFRQWYAGGYAVSTRRYALPHAQELTPDQIELRCFHLLSYCTAFIRPHTCSLLLKKAMVSACWRITSVLTRVAGGRHAGRSPQIAPACTQCHIMMLPPISTCFATNHQMRIHVNLLSYHRKWLCWRIVGLRLLPMLE